MKKENWNKIYKSENKKIFFFLQINVISIYKAHQLVPVEHAN